MKYNANATILAAVLIAAGSTLAADRLKNKPVRYGRTTLGALGLGFGLSVVATGAPNIANQLAWLIIITSVLVNGQPIFDRITAATTNTGTKAGKRYSQTTVEA